MSKTYSTVWRSIPPSRVGDDGGKAEESEFGGGHDSDVDVEKTQVGVDGFE